jgi:hypothetical protein
MNTVDNELEAVAKEIDGVLRTNRDGKVQIIIPQKLTFRVMKIMTRDTSVIPKH